jgi:hypothetical protein
MLLTQLLEFNHTSDKKEYTISDIYGIIYRIYCKPENKSYIGQTLSHCKTKGKFIKKGILKRVKEHYTVRNDDVFNTKPLYIALNKYSTDDFEVYEEEKVYRNDLARLNEIEGKYIQKYNSLKPNGYNSEEIGKIYPKILHELAKHYNFEIQRIKYVDKTRKKRCKDVCFGVRFECPKIKHTLDIVREKLKTIEIESIRLMKSKKDSRMIVKEKGSRDNIRIYVTDPPDVVIDFAREFTNNVIIAESFKESYKYQNKLDEVLEMKTINKVTSHIYHNSARDIDTYLIKFFGQKNDRNQLLYKVSFGGKTINIKKSLVTGLDFIVKYKEACNNKNIKYEVATELPNNSPK